MAVLNVTITSTASARSAECSWTVDELQENDQNMRRDRTERCPIAECNDVR
jgi:hypothetical protein